MKLFVFDVETGGFKPEQHPVCEIAVVIIDLATLEKVDRYEAVVAPYKPLGNEPVYTSKALEINGLTMKKIEAGTPARTVAADLKALAKKHKVGREKPILCGHNIDGFDIGMLGALLESNGVSDANSLFSTSTADTLMFAKMIWPIMGSEETIVNRKLGTVCGKFDIELVDAHSAMPDTEANADMIIQIIKRMRSTGMVDLDNNSSEKSRVSFQF